MSESPTFTETVNPLTQKIRMPGSTIRLPSNGLFYNNEELSSNISNGEIQIYPMTAMDDIIIKSPDKMLSGNAITEVFSRCAPEVLKPLDLLTKDIDYILVNLRLITYGNTFEAIYNHGCNESKDHTYMIDTAKFISDSVPIDPTTFEKTFTKVINTIEQGQKVTFQPMRFKHIVEMMQALNDDEKDADYTNASIFKALLSVIRDVDGHSDRNNILEWLSQLNVKQVTELTDHVDSINNWGCSFDSTEKCKDCGEEIVITIPLNPISFFI